MSRHRNIRNLSYEDELSDDVYGRSLDEMDYCVSPATEAEFMFRRDKHHTLSSFINEDENNCIEEEEEDLPVQTSDYKQPLLDEMERAKLASCMEQLEDILGDTMDEDTVRRAVLDQRFNVEHALDQLLNKDTTKSSSRGPMTPKPTVTEYYGNNISDVVTTPKSNKKKKDALNASSGNSTPKTGSRAPSRENLLDDTPTRIQTPKPSKSREMIDVGCELQKRQDGKELINLVVIGHVDAGKSTLMGHLLYNLGNVSKRVMHKNETESKKFGKGSFAFAWVLDETEEERSRGITMDVAMTIFETKTKIVTLMDAPGHRDFIPNMIQGTSQADVAILVIDSRVGEFEAGFEAGGQTREHAILARSLGVAQIIVAVNKMDAVEWAKDRYDEIVLKLKSFLLKQARFREADIHFVPCSGLSGENLTEQSKETNLTQWYTSECVVQLIDSFTAPKRPIDKPFRFCVSDVYKGSGSFVVAGKVESGSVQNGDRVLLMPSNEPGLIKGLSVRDEQVRFAAAGDQISAAIHGVDIAHVNVGNVICDIENPIKVTQRIVARIVVFNITIPVTKGFTVVFHSQNASEPAIVSRLVSILNKSSGEVVQKRPRCLTKQMNAVIEIKFARAICIERYCDNKVLGRFMLRYSGKTLAAGVVTEVK